MAKPQMSDPTPIEIEGDDAPAESAATPAPVLSSASVKQQSMYDKMRAHFAKQKRVRVKVHNDAPVPVQVQGYTFLIRENVPVEVPEQIAEMLEEAGYI